MAFRETHSAKVLQKRKLENGAGALWLSPAQPFKVMFDRIHCLYCVRFLKREGESVIGWLVKSSSLKYGCFLITLLAS